jgi:carboxyvinyl-carboxyphosphonate phosphorylmutase
MADLLSTTDPRPNLRSLITTAIDDRQPLVVPGCYDALGARLIEQAGFSAAYMSGFGTTAGLLGRPDVGLLGLSEMADNARRLVGAVDIPVIADADTGYGNEINVVRTVIEYERAGVQGLHIEDQVMPKRCGHMEDKQVVSADEMVAKVRAAIAARTKPDTVVIARTDARAPNGLDDAIDRARGCREAGADVLFVEALEGRDELERVATELAGVPLLFNWVEGGKTPPLTKNEIADLGFAIIIMPIGTLLAATRAMQQFLVRLRADGTPADFVDELMPFHEFTDTIGLPEFTELGQRFG